MDLTQLINDLAVIAGILLMAVLAVGPLWLADKRQAQAATPPRAVGTSAGGVRGTPGQG